uniref:VWFA domain-containing protein n=1 Tax=Caenorhabditis tropicalis TaxID=1561998 RepID=A0A1I7UG46_9PELO
MTFNSSLLFLLFSVLLCYAVPISRSSNCADSYIDRLCGEDQSNLWLDIVVVVDNSQGMTKSGLTAVAAEISSLFVSTQQLGIQPNNPRTSRIGIVTYNQEATVVAGLNNFTTVDDLTETVYAALNNVAPVKDSYLHTGLEKANDIFEQESFNTDRAHYKKLVIVYASEYRGTGQQDPLPLAIRMQQTISIATVAYSQDDNVGLLAQLSEIATPGFNFTNENAQDTVPQLRATMLQVNCYCPNGWFQMRQSYTNEYSFKYGICILPVTLQATWLASKLSCRNHWNRAYLLNEYTKTKHDYVLQIVSNVTAFKQPYTYFNGLSYVNGNWQWEQPVGESPIQLQSWTYWNPGYPTSSSTATVGVNVQPSTASISTGWQNTNRDLTNMYICVTKNHLNELRVHSSDTLSEYSTLLLILMTVSIPLSVINPSVWFTLYMTTFIHMLHFKGCLSQNSPPSAKYYDRNCGEDLGNLWLEIVAVVDNSKGMTNSGIINIAANIASVVSNGTRIGIDSSEPRTTRLGLVTYNAVATQVANLDTYHSIDDVFDGVFTALGSVSSSDESYLVHGLAEAENILEEGKQAVNRSHFQRVVIVYASTYKGTGALDPIPVADRLKTSGVTVITVAYDQDGDGALLHDLAKIATSHFNYTNTDDSGNVVGEIQGALLQVNCFCPNGWTQFRVSYNDINSYRYGVCIQPQGLMANWRAAQASCRAHWKNAFLVNEYDQNKHDYVLTVVKNTTGFNSPLSYHVGLNLIKGVWTWDQPVGWAQPSLQNWIAWNPSFPVASSTLTGVLNQQPSLEIKVGWQNVSPYTTAANYVCETASCDTDNYCSSVSTDNALRH